MKNLTADVVVIGGGVNGCSTAYHLAKAGLKNVVLVEKGHVASGPTGLSSGVVREYYTLEPLAMMARDSVKVLKNFHELIGGEAGFVQCGIVFVSGPADDAVIRESVDMHRRIGITEELLLPDRLLEMEPQLNTDGIAYGVYEPSGGYADPALVANSFANAAKREGVKILHNTEVTGIGVEGGRVTSVLTHGGPIYTENVVNLAGPWGRKISNMVGIEIPLTASRHPVQVLQRPESWRTPTPVWSDLVSGWYFKPEARHGIMVGSLTEVESDRDVEVEGYAMTTTFEEAAPYAEAITHRFPIMQDGSLTSGWAGLYDVTPDGVPIIDSFGEVRGFFCAVGWNGHGFKTSPALGALMAELITTGTCKTYDLTIFRHDRFDSNTSKMSRTAYAIIG
ncbi:MAG TPA: FAD-binding oxidoreductase [Candidatus Baltobacteraceae bacterium]|jgi:sarcosine oxidase subunit beta|nr:FAD-binding oxidoreductase [Candidatus Baltobacteraceae bacterium]